MFEDDATKTVLCDRSQVHAHYLFNQSFISGDLIGRRTYILVNIVDGHPEVKIVFRN